MSGLGLDDFLNHNKGGSGAKIFNLKKAGKANVWLHTRAKIAYPVWSHRFPVFTAKEEEVDGEKVEKVYLFRPRFISPDPEIINKEQYFRYRAGEGPEDQMKRPPIIDPFLLLREWLRNEIKAGNISEDTVVFRWENDNPREWESRIEEWRAGRLAKLVDSTKSTWNHSLDSKLEYIFVVVDDENPDDGAQLVWGAKGLGEAMQKEIAAQCESNGRDEGNPLVTPYCFRWIYDKDAKSFSDTYRAHRFNKARLTDEIRAAIREPDFPDPTPMTQPKPGDKARIRAAFEDAAQIDLPYDRLFLPEWKDENPEDFNFGHNATDSADAGTMGSDAKARRTPDVETKRETKRETKSTSSSSSSRRKKAETKSEPKIEIEPCEDCGFPMNARWTECPECGAVYEVEGGMEPPPIEKLNAAGWREKYGAEASPGGETDGAAEEKTETKADGPDQCWACQADITPDMKKCPGCGIDLGDDLDNLYS